MEQFDSFSDVWWHKEGPLWTLHALQSLRVSLVDDYGPLLNKRVLDVGCGGGLFAESVMLKGADVTAFDISPELIASARQHLIQAYSASCIDYLVGDSMDQAMYSGSYDLVCAFEVIEHIEKPFVAIDNMINALTPGGLLMISSPNRTAWGFFSTIIIPEYLLSWLPVGTHRYHMFTGLDTVIAHIQHKGCTIVDVRGMWYYPMLKIFAWSSITSAHYTVVARKNAPL